MRIKKRWRRNNGVEGVMQSCLWGEGFSQTTATAFCPTIHQGIRGCMPTHHDDKYACQPSTVQFWQLGISTAQINFQSQTLRKDVKFTALDSQEALIFTGGRQKKIMTGSICHLTMIKTIFFSKQDIFVKVLRSPKIKFRAEGGNLKAEKGKKKVCGLLLHKEWLL